MCQHLSNIDKSHCPRIAILGLGPATSMDLTNHSSLMSSPKIRVAHNQEILITSKE